MAPMLFDYPMPLPTRQVGHERDGRDGRDDHDADDDTFYPEDDDEPMAESDFQRDSLIYAVEALDYFYADDPNVYVSGNLFIYLEKGNPRAVVSPDAFTVHGVEKYQRKTYKLWLEKIPPSFIIEVTSDSTRDRDEIEKPLLYEELGVKEYIQFDPTEDYLKPALKGRRLNQWGKYMLIPTHTMAGGILCIESHVTGLELHLDAGKLRLYNPVNRDYLLTYREEATRRRLEEIERRKAEDRFKQADEERRKAEDRIKHLEAELARLQQQQH